MIFAMFNNVYKIPDVLFFGHLSRTAFVRQSAIYRPTSHGDYVALFYIATYSTQVTCSSVDYSRRS